MNDLRWRMRLSPEKRALVTRIGSMGVSDEMFLAAQVIVEMMRFSKGSLLRARTISEITGLSTATVRQAANNLLALGAMDIEIRWRGRYSTNMYRLSASFLARGTFQGRRGADTAEARCSDEAEAGNHR